MPALRSLYTVSLLAACLAQAWAGPAHDAAVRRDDHMGGGGDKNYGGYGGDDKGYDDQSGDWQDYNGGDYKPEGGVIVTVTQWMTLTAPAPEQKNVETQTVTITAVAPCDQNVVTATAWVTTCPGGAQWPAPSAGCMPCQGGSPSFPPVPPNGGGLGNCPLLTTSNLVLGRTSIPAAEAVQTGVTVAGPGPGAAPAVTAAPYNP